MGATVPLSVSKAVGWFEKISGLDETLGFAQDPLVNTVVKDLLKKLESGAPPRKRAPRMLSCFIPALEKLVVDPKVEERIRAGAWMKLLKIWGSLRFDDVAHLKKDMVTSYDGRFSGMLKRTKTTGAGKRVKELPFHISSQAWAEHPTWMAAGLEALGKALAGTFELLVPAGTSTCTARQAVMPYQEAVAWSTDVMSALVDKAGGRLIPDGWERFWTEHSERATLVSGLAALGVAKSERDLLGRWKPEGSDQYVRSYNAAVGRLQNQFAQPIKVGEGYNAFDEGSVLEELKLWLVEKWQVDQKIACDAVDAWKEKIRPYTPFADLVEGKETGEFAGPQPLFDSSSSSSSGTESSTSGDESGVKKRRVEKLDEDRGTGYVVVYNRIDRGKLHRAGAKGCWMARSRKFKRAMVYESLPEATEYTTRCMLCWPEGHRDDGSSSDSEDELDFHENSVPPKGDGVSPMYSEPAAGSGQENQD